MLTHARASLLNDLDRRNPHAPSLTSSAPGAPRGSLPDRSATRPAGLRTTDYTSFGGSVAHPASCRPGRRAAWCIDDDGDGQGLPLAWIRRVSNVPDTDG